MAGEDYNSYGDQTDYRDGPQIRDGKSTDATQDMNTTDHYYYEYYGYDMGPYYSLSSYYIDRVGNIPISVLGTVGNVLVFIVWSTQKKYNATIFLIKLLAVWDTLFLVTYAPLIFLYEKNPYSDPIVAVNFVSFVAKLESVHTTLLISLSRWLAVFRAVQVHSGSLLARRHIIVACIVVFVWCVGIASVVLVFNLLPEGHSTEVTWLIVSIVTYIVGLVVPVVPLVIFNVLLLVKLRSPHLPTSSSYQQQSSSWGNNRRLTVTVMLMSLFSVPPYTIGVTVTVVNWFKLWDGENLAADVTVFYTLGSTVQLLEQINCSINIIFYLVFSRKFRKLFSKCFQRCIYRSRKPSARSAVKRDERRVQQ